MAELITNNGIDQECIALCAAINEIPGLRTVSSCSGHFERPMWIAIKVDDYAGLPILLYCTQRFCHEEFAWGVYAETDGAMSQLVYYLESESVGEDAYREAEIIAQLIWGELEAA